MITATLKCPTCQRELTVPVELVVDGMWMVDGPNVVMAVNGKVDKAELESVVQQHAPECRK